MSITVGDVLRVTASMLFTDGNVAQMVFNAVISGSGGPYTDADIVLDALAWMDAIGATITASLTNTLDGNEIIVYLYDAVDDDWDEVGADTWTWNPSSAGDAMPRGVATLVNARTTDPDVNGKKYVPGFTEGSSTDGTWSAGTVTLMADWADEWTDTFTGGTSGADWVPGIWSPKNTNFFAFSGSYVIPTEPAYQRRRKRGVGV